MQVQNSLKICSKNFEKYFLKILPHFLVEDAKPFHLRYELFFYCQ